MTVREAGEICGKCCSSTDTPFLSPAKSVVDDCLPGARSEAPSDRVLRTLPSSRRSLGKANDFLLLAGKELRGFFPLACKSCTPNPSGGQTQVSVVWKKSRLDSPGSGGTGAEPRPEPRAAAGRVTNALPLSWGRASPALLLFLLLGHSSVHSQAGLLS